MADFLLLLGTLFHLLFVPYSTTSSSEIWINWIIIRQQLQIDIHSSVARWQLPLPMLKTPLINIDSRAKILQIN